jgi:hypothetical protein
MGNTGGANRALQEREGGAAVGFEPRPYNDATVRKP